MDEDNDEGAACAGNCSLFEFEVNEFGLSWEVNEFGLPWEEFVFVNNRDESKLSIINDLLKSGYGVSEVTPVGDTVLFRLQKVKGA